MAVQLTNRDYKLMKWLCEMPGSSVSILSEAFTGVKKPFTNFRTRIRKLEDEGYLMSKTTPCLGPQRLYFATKKGWFFAQKGLFDLHIPYPRARISPSILSHDQLLMKCRMRLEKFENAGDWRSERRLMFEFKKLHQAGVLRRQIS